MVRSFIEKMLVARNQNLMIRYQNFQNLMREEKWREKETSQSFLFAPWEIQKDRKCGKRNEFWGDHLDLRCLVGISERQEIQNSAETKARRCVQSKKKQVELEHQWPRIAPGDTSISLGGHEGRKEAPGQKEANKRSLRS